MWLGWTLWQALKLDGLLSALLPRGREAVAWPDVIAILAIGRLCEPSSELHVAEQWYRTTALETCWAWRPRASTTSGCIARSTGCCRTSVSLPSGPLTSTSSRMRRQAVLSSISFVQRLS